MFEIKQDLLVAGVGFEPTTFRLWAWRATGLLHPAPRKEKPGRRPPGRPVCKVSDPPFCDASWSWKTRQRPTLPCLKTKYHRRYRLSRPSSEWDRVGHLCHNHLVIQTHKTRKPGHHRRQQREEKKTSKTCRRPFGAALPNFLKKSSVLGVCLQDPINNGEYHLAFAFTYGRSSLSND